MRTAEKETKRVKKAGEALVRQLERQNAAYGLTREELRRLKAEEKALATDRAGNLRSVNFRPLRSLLFVPFARNGLEIVPIGQRALADSFFLTAGSRPAANWAYPIVAPQPA